MNIRAVRQMNIVLQPHLAPYLPNPRANDKQLYKPELSLRSRIMYVPDQR
jgi:hypothetical protein